MARDARSRVDHPHLLVGDPAGPLDGLVSIPAVVRTAPGPARRCAAPDPSHLEAERPRAGHGLHGVQRDVEQDLGHQIGVNVYRREPGRHVDLDHDARLGDRLGGQLEHALDAGRERRWAQLRRARERVLEQPGHDPVESAHLVQDDPDVARALVARLEAAEQHLGAGADPGQRIADLVGGASGQLAEGREPLVTAQLLLHPPGPCLVTQRDDDPRRASEPDAAQQRGHLTPGTREQHDLALGGGPPERIPHWIVARDHRAQEIHRAGTAHTGGGQAEDPRGGGVQLLDTPGGIHDQDAGVAVHHERPGQALGRWTTSRGSPGARYPHVRSIAGAS